MSAKIQRVLARQKAKIEEGDYYEAHQQIRTIANRYVKTSDWPAAIELLSTGASLLLKANQGGSGGDLCNFLVEIYTKASVPSDTTSKARLIDLLRAFPPGEPSKKSFVAGIVSWSSTHSDFPAGDPELHHAIGCVWVAEGAVGEAERHFALGTGESAANMAALEYEWYASDAPSTAGHYAARAVLPYLLLGNVRAANKSLLLFTAHLSAAHPALGVQSISSPSADIRIYPSLPLVNFLGLLLLAVQRGGADLFKTLKNHYAAVLKEVGWEEPLAIVGEMYFGIKIPSQSNPMMDIMSSMLMGGGNPFGARKKELRSVGAAASAPPSTPPAPPPALD